MKTPWKNIKISEKAWKDLNEKAGSLGLTQSETILHLKKFHDERNKSNKN